MAKTTFVDPTRGKTFKQRFIGDKNFYRMIFGVVIPIMIQNGITNFVNMLDNLMVGRIGTEQMSGVSIVNTLIFVYNLCIFGGLSGIGIFTAQFYGKKDDEGIRDSFRAKLWLGIFLSILAASLFVFFQDELIGLYLTGEGTKESIAQTLQAGKEYLMVMVISFPAFALVQVYATTLRECGETVLPMKAGLIAVFVNLVLNYLLIYGSFGFPCLGVQGAAIATAISRYIEAAIVIIYVHSHAKIHTWAIGLYKSLKVNTENLKKYVFKGSPILFNEALWSSGIAILSQCYSTRSLDVVAALNIASTINNVLNVGFLAFGSAVGIVVGQRLGAGRMEEAKDYDNKMIFTGIMFGVLSGIILLCVSPFFPLIYETEDSVRALATSFIMIYACANPQSAFNNGCYFTLRSGGKTLITCLFDCGTLWIIQIPIVFLLTKVTTMSALALYICYWGTDLIKASVGFVLVRKNIWMNNIVDKGEK